METKRKCKSRGEISQIQFLGRWFAITAIILLLIDGGHAHHHSDLEERAGDHTPVQKPNVHGEDAPRSEVIIDGEWGMVKKKGSQFVVGDRPFYFNGFNTYQLMLLAVEPSTRGNVTEVFQQASAVGLTVCRTWAFNDGGWMALQKSPSVYDENVFEALDFVVSEAMRHRIRLILSLIDNWDGYGGKAQYVKWAREAGVNVSHRDDFFSDQTVKGYFKNHIKNILTRVNTYTNVTYMDDPTIFAWELMNEPRCTSDPTGNKLQAWIREMALHVKSIDTGHLLEIGAEGFYGPSSPDRLPDNPNSYNTGTDFIRNHRVLGIDFASVHMYPDTWLSNGTSLKAQLKFARSWMQAHIADGEGALGMPVVFAEFGLSTNKTPRASASSRDRFILAVYRELLRSARRGGAGAGGLLWQVLPPEGPGAVDDGYGVALPRAAATAAIMSAHSKKLQTFNAEYAWSCRWGRKKREKHSRRMQTACFSAMSCDRREYTRS